MCPDYCTHEALEYARKIKTDTKNKEANKMKHFVAIAKKTVNDRDGFVHGFIKGVVGSAVFISLLTLFTACFG